MQEIQNMLELEWTFYVWVTSSLKTTSILERTSIRITHFEVEIKPIAAAFNINLLTPPDQFHGGNYGPKHGKA